MSALAQVPAWFWVTLGTLLAVGGATAWLLHQRLRSGAWRWRYQPEHVAGPALSVELPATLATVPVAAVNGKPPWEVAYEPMAAEVAASRALHGYIPELDPGADDLGPGAGLDLSPGYNSRLPSPTSERMKVDSPAPDDLAPVIDLGPRARMALERWERRHQERWSLTWDNSAEVAA